LSQKKKPRFLLGKQGRYCRLPVFAKSYSMVCKVCKGGLILSRQHRFLNPRRHNPARLHFNPHAAMGLTLLR
jgi:hypothetical protein